MNASTKNHIRQKFYKRLIAPSFFLVASIIMLVAVPFSAILSPVEILADSDLSDSYSESQSYVKVTYPNLYYTGYDSTYSDKITGHYYYYLSQRRLTLILVPGKSAFPETFLENYTCSGIIEKSDDNISKLLGNFSSDIELQTDDLTNMTSPYYINEVNYHPTIYKYIQIALYIIIALQVIILAFNLFYLIFPEHYISRKKSKK